MFMSKPSFVGLDDTPTYVENGPRIILDDDATIVDADVGAGPFTGATLTLARDGGASPNDVFEASGPVQLSDGQVLLTVNDPPSGQIDLAVGSYTNQSGTLVITFNDQATSDRLNEVLQHLNYSNGSTSPPASALIDYVFDDGEQATGSILVQISGTNDPPALDSVTPTAVFRPGGGPIALSAGIAGSVRLSCRLGHRRATRRNHARIDPTNVRCAPCPP
jgi:hypothetical protein